MARRLPKTITVEEFEAILRQASRRAPSGVRNRAILWAMWDAGLRVSEVCDLAPGDVRRRSMTLRLRHAKGDKDREVPATDAVMSAIEAWERIRGRGGSWLFCTVADRNKLSDRYVRAMVARYSTRADVFKTVTEDGVNVQRPVNPHQLRHSYATRLLRRGVVELDELQELLGHASIATTRVYTQVDHERLAEKVRAGLAPEPGEDAADLRAMIRTIMRQELGREMIAEMATELAAAQGNGDGA
jgi:integrase/recombinase XerD